MLHSLTQFAGYGFLTQRMQRLFVALLLLTITITLCGYVFLAAGWLSDRYGWIGSLILFLSLLVLALSERRMKSAKRVVLEAIMLGFGAFGVEIVGLHTGFPFGNYSYTETLGFHIAGVPLAIGAAWYVTIVSARRICQTASRRPIRTALCSAVLTLAFDIALEPMAWHVAQYWQWQADQVPIQNYASWFVISFVAVVLLEQGERTSYRAPTPSVRLTALLILTLFIGLFTTVSIAGGYIREPIIACLLCAVTVLAGSRESLSALLRGK
jgi:putative membrane protein